eukprot:403372242
MNKNNYSQFHRARTLIAVQETTSSNNSTILNKDLVNHIAHTNKNHSNHKNKESMILKKQQTFVSQSKESPQQAPLTNKIIDDYTNQSVIKTKFSENFKEKAAMLRRMTTTTFSSNNSQNRTPKSKLSFLQSRQDGNGNQTPSDYNTSKIHTSQAYNPLNLQTLLNIKRNSTTPITNYSKIQRPQTQHTACQIAKNQFKKINGNKLIQQTYIFPFEEFEDNKQQEIAPKPYIHRRLSTSYQGNSSDSQFMKQINPNAFRQYYPQLQIIDHPPRSVDFQNQFLYMYQDHSMSARQRKQNLLSRLSKKKEDKIVQYQQMRKELIERQKRLELETMQKIQSEQRKIDFKLNKAASKIQRAYLEWRKEKFREAVVRYINRDKFEIEKGKQDLGDILVDLKFETEAYYQNYLRKNISCIIKIQRFFRDRKKKKNQEFEDNVEQTQTFQQFQNKNRSTFASKKVKQSYNKINFY